MNSKFTNYAMIFIVGLFLLCVSQLNAQQSRTNNENATGIVNGVVKVKFKPTQSAKLRTAQIRTKNNRLRTGITAFDNAAQSIKAYDMERLFPYDPQIEDKLQKHGLDLWYIVSIPKTIDPKEAARTFGRLNEVSIAEVQNEKILEPSSYKEYKPTGKKALSTLPFNDPMLADQWHYQNWGQTGHTGGADVNLFKAWGVTAGKKDIIISIHDEGVDVNHEDLKDNLWVNEKELNGLPGVDDDNNGYIDDIHGYNYDTNRGNIAPQMHGTHVAGTIAAVNNNNIGVSGVAGGSGKKDGAKIMSLQVMSSGLIERSYIYAAKMGAVISQNSWGYRNAGGADESVAEAIRYFIAEAGNYEGSPLKGGIVIFAAGNSNLPGNWYPGRYEYVLSVTALGPTWKKAAYSNYDFWTDVAAPGGDGTSFGTSNMVLSTLPYNKYGYNQGTSMACPHVSGIAALAIANSARRMTAQELWNKLVSGVINIDQYNPEYKGQLGSGAIDAFLAIQNDKGIAPAKINDLNMTGVAQDFVKADFTVPADEDDAIPFSFEIYYSEGESIDPLKLNSYSSKTFRNFNSAGSKFDFEIGELNSKSQYYLAVIAIDRWGNRSGLSNIIKISTSVGSSININTGAVDKSIELSINTAVNNKGDKSFKILNDSVGVLRWNFSEARNTTISYSYNQFSAFSNSPGTPPKYLNDIFLSSSPVENNQEIDIVTANVEKIPRTPWGFVTKTKMHHDGWPLGYLGEDNDSEAPTSIASKFFVEEEDGFNLTQLKVELGYTRGSGPLNIEIYKGSDLIKNNLIFVQSFTPSAGFGEKTITLTEQLFFEKNSIFWIALHLPEGNPIAWKSYQEKEKGLSKNCYYSSDFGQNWHALTNLLKADNVVWSTKAISAAEHFGRYITLDPVSGEVAGKSEASVILKADASNLINGTYRANVIIKSNDDAKQETRIPVTTVVTGQKPNVIHPTIVEFGQVFEGLEKSIDIILDNQGYGLVKSLTYSIAGAGSSDFKIGSGTPTSIDAKDKIKVRVTFKPTSIGNKNVVLKATNGTYTYNISLFGICPEASKAVITPMTQSFAGLTIGDNVNANFNITNTGKYPLKYFIPGFDTKSVSKDWDVPYHKYGYRIRQSTDLTDPLPYDFVSIATTGVDITPDLLLTYYKKVDFGFDFPFYSSKQSYVFVSRNGYITFTKDKNPTNVPALGSVNTPNGCISPYGSTNVSYSRGGKIYYKKEHDKLVIEYNNAAMTTNDDTGNFTIQIVMYSNGNIRYYYDKLPTKNIYRNYSAVLIEDLEQKDGIALVANGATIPYVNGTVVGFDYPVSNDIIKNVSNGSGILAPGESSTVNVALSTASLYQLPYKKYLNVITNDPKNGRIQPSVDLDIVAGGSSNLEILDDIIDFEDIYLNGFYTKTIKIKNNGTKIMNLLSSGNTDFIQSLNIPVTKAYPGEIFYMTVEPKTSTLGSFNDYFWLKFEDGVERRIYVKGNVVSKPIASNINLTSINETLTIGQTKSIPYSIDNTGGGDLRVSFGNEMWYKFIPESNANVVDHDYTLYTHRGDEPTFNWIDITKTGVKLLDPPNGATSSEYWNLVKDLSFPIMLYGVKYDSMKIAKDGIIALTGNPMPMDYKNVVPMPFDDNNVYIAPLQLGVRWDAEKPEEIVGTFYQIFEDKIVVSWESVFDATASGSNSISFQAVIYKDGTMKFQYKLAGDESGFERTSKRAQVALQGLDDNFLLINRDIFLDHGKGLAYLLAPKTTYSVPSGGKIQGNIILDATQTYVGSYADRLKIYTNDQSKLILEKPISLNITGSVPTFTSPTEFAFGDVVTEEDVTLQMPFVIMNEGKKPLEISKVIMKKKDQSLNLSLLLKNSYGIKVWTEIQDDFTGAASDPVIKLLPNEKLYAKALFGITDSIKAEDEIIFTTNIGEKRIKLKGDAYNPPVFGIKAKSLSDTVYQVTDKLDKSFKINNDSGDYKLKYDISIQYKRPKPKDTKIANYMMSTSPLALPMGFSENLGVKETFSSKVSAKSAKNITFNRVLEYFGEEKHNINVGYKQGTYALQTATRFNAGPTGFNLTDVGTFFVREKSRKGTVYVEIRVGGKSIRESQSIAKTSITYDESADDLTGKMYNFTFDEPVDIYPNEDFYVCFTYPLTIESPQGGYNVDAAEIPLNTYFIEYNNIFFDLALNQDVVELKNSSWIMYAAERDSKNIGWINLKTASKGELASTQSKNIELAFEAKGASRGTQEADIVIRTNDLEKPMVAIPASLHFNEAPYIQNLSDKITLRESILDSIKCKVVDKESNKFTFEILEKPDFVESKIKGDSITFVFNAPYGKVGVYNLKIKTEDQYNASTVFNTSINVLKTNRAPRYKGNDTIEVSINNSKLFDFNIRDLFEDPDGDSFTYEVKSLTEDIITVYSSTQSNFILKPNKVGIGKLSFNVLDSNNGLTTKVVHVEIVECLNPEGLIVQKWNNTLFLSDKDNKYKEFQWYKNGLPIAGATKKYYTVSATTDEMLDFTALYSIALKTITGSAFWTCTMTPVKKETELKVYPNPIKRSGIVNVELPEMDDETVTIQIINASGQTVKAINSVSNSTKIQVPETSGSYFVKVINGGASQVFKIIVE